MGFFRKLFGHRRRVEQAPTMSPQQIAAQNQALQLAMGHLQNPAKGFESIAQQARSKFQTDTIPMLSRRFASQGGLGSSGFRGALGGAATGLEEQLASMGSQYGLQNVGQFANVLGMGLRPQFENLVDQGSSGLFGGLASGILPFAGMGLGLGAFGNLMPKSFRKF
jgi:hypothetical protein